MLPGSPPSSAHNWERTKKGRKSNVKGRRSNSQSAFAAQHTLAVTDSIIPALAAETIGTATSSVPVRSSTPPGSPPSPTHDWGTNSTATSTKRPIVRRGVKRSLLHTDMDAATASATTTTIAARGAAVAATTVAAEPDGVVQSNTSTCVEVPLVGKFGGADAATTTLNQPPADTADPATVRRHPRAYPPLPDKAMTDMYTALYLKGAGFGYTGMLSNRETYGTSRLCSLYCYCSIFLCVSMPIIILFFDILLLLERLMREKGADPVPEKQKESDSDSESGASEAAYVPFSQPESENDEATLE